MFVVITMAGVRLGRETHHKPLDLFCYLCYTTLARQPQAPQKKTIKAPVLLTRALTHLTPHCQGRHSSSWATSGCAAASATAPPLTPAQLSRTRQHPLAAPADASAGRPGLGAGRRRRGAPQRGRHRRGRLAYVGLAVRRGHSQPAQSAPRSQCRVSSAPRGWR